MNTGFIGEIRLFAGDFAPEGWAICDGRVLAIAQYEMLFMLIGTAYGGDGDTTFALPNLQRREAVHRTNNVGPAPEKDFTPPPDAEMLTYIISLFGLYPPER